jgi:hypothetical protein
LKGFDCRRLAVLFGSAVWREFAVMIPGLARPVLDTLLESGNLRTIETNTA